MDNNDKLKKMNSLKVFLSKNSHKLDYLIAVIFLGLGIYKYINNDNLFFVYLIVSVISFTMALWKPVRKFDDYLNKKIIKK